jgi:hypothetical protein
MSLRVIGLELANRELCTKARAHKPCREIPSLVDRLGFGSSTTPGLISDKRGRGEQRPQGMAVSVVSEVSDSALLPGAFPCSPSPGEQSENRGLGTGCNFTDFTDLTELPLLAPLKSLDYSPATSRDAAAY